MFLEVKVLSVAVLATFDFSKLSCGKYLKLKSYFVLNPNTEHSLVLKHQHLLGGSFRICEWHCIGQLDDRINLHYNLLKQSPSCLRWLDLNRKIRDECQLLLSVSEVGMLRIFSIALTKHYLLHICRNQTIVKELLFEWVTNLTPQCETVTDRVDCRARLSFILPEKTKNKNKTSIWSSRSPEGPGEGTVIKDLLFLTPAMVSTGQHMLVWLVKCEQCFWRFEEDSIFKNSGGPSQRDNGSQY